MSKRKAKLIQFIEQLLYKSDCPIFTLMIHLFSDHLAVLSIPYIHEMCVHIALFSSSVLGTQRPFQFLKSCPSDMRNFLDFFIDDLCFSETPAGCALCFLILVSCLFNLFLLSCQPLIYFLFVLPGFILSNSFKIAF